jgi:hypothetical protein
VYFDSSIFLYTSWDAQWQWHFLFISLIANKSYKWCTICFIHMECVWYGMLGLETYQCGWRVIHQTKNTISINRILRLIFQKIKLKKIPRRASSGRWNKPVLFFLLLKAYEFLLRASLRVPKTVSQSRNFGKTKKTHLQQHLNPRPNLLALGKNHPRAHKVTWAYRHANLEVEGRGQEKSRIGFLMQIYKREIKYKSN